MNANAREMTEQRVREAQNVQAARRAHARERAQRRHERAQRRQERREHRLLSRKREDYGRAV
nr:hypothetical protein [Nocardiopsis sinuspersici]